MEICWTATASGVLGVEHRTTEDKYVAAMDALMAGGEGYTEVRSGESDCPVLTLGFRGGRAALHQFRDEETIYLLSAGEQSNFEGAVSLPSIDGDVEFEAAFVLPVDQAWALAGTFISTDVVEGVGAWILL